MTPFALLFVYPRPPRPVLLCHLLSLRVKCQTVCDLPTGAVHAIHERALRNIGSQSFGWAGEHLTTHGSLWGDAIGTYLTQQVESHRGCFLAQWAHARQ